MFEERRRQQRRSRNPVVSAYPLYYCPWIWILSCLASTVALPVYAAIGFAVVSATFAIAALVVPLWVLSAYVYTFVSGYRLRSHARHVVMMQICRVLA